MKENGWAIEELAAGHGTSSRLRRRRRFRDEEGFGRRGRGRSVGGRSSLTTTNLRSLTTTNLRTRNEEEATAGGSVDFGGVGPSPTIVGGDDLTRRAAHARMDPVDGAFGLRGGGVSLDAGSDAVDGVPR